MRIVSILIILVSIIPLLSVDATDSKLVQTGGTVVGWRVINYPGPTSEPVPSGLSGVVAVAASFFPPFLHSLALKSDGTVVAWGDNSSGQTTVPAGLSDVVAIAAGDFQSLALKSDGTVVAWGSSFSVPAGLSGVVAIAANGDGNQNLALKSDGTVVAWGSSSSVPSGLSGVVAIAAGVSHSLALKSDGTVVAWGSSSSGQTTVPAGLSGVVAIAAGSDYSLVSKSDGTVVAWGEYYSVPSGLSGVVAIAAGVGHSLALKSDGTVVAWNSKGQTITVPTGLSRVTAIYAGYGFNLVIMKNPVVAQPVSVVTPNPTIGPGGVLTITQVLRNTLSIGVTENYLASPPPGFTLIPGSCTSTIGGCVIESAPTSSQNQTGLARRSLAEAQSNSQTLTWSGVIPGNGTVTITYQVRVGTQTGGSRQVCLTPTLGGAPATPTCVMVTPLSGPGNVPLAAGLPQKPGSVLIYNSGASDFCVGRVKNPGGYETLRECKTKNFTKSCSA